MKNQEPFEAFSVMNTNGNSVAQLSNVIFDWQSGRAKLAVLLLLENVDRQRAFTVVPWEVLKYDTNARAIVLMVSNDKLSRAPAVDPDKLPASIGGNWGQEFYAHFGVETPNEAVGGNAPAAGAAKGEAAGLPSAKDPVGRGSAFFLYAVAVLLLFAIGFLYATRKRWAGPTDRC